jgi:hypothetical protein
MEGRMWQRALPRLDRVLRLRSGQAPPRPHTTSSSVLYVDAATYGRFRPVCSGLPNP